MPKLKIIITLVGVLLFSGCAYYNTFYNATKFYKDGEKERKKREKTQVVELSAEEEEQLKKTGRSGSEERGRASQQEMQQYQQAIERASRVLEYFPESRWVDDALMLLGRCFYYRRDFKKADRKFDELLQLYPNSDFIPEARLLKAKTYIGMEDYDTAEKQLLELAEDEKMPKNMREQARYELGGLYFQKENYEKAAENYRSSSRSADDKLVQAMSLYKLGDCLIRLKKYDEAPDIFRRAIKMAPNEDFNSQAMFKLAQVYNLQLDYERAIKTFRTLLSKEFEEKRIPRIKLELAENLRQKGDLNEAIKWYKEIIELHKRTDASARAYFALAEVEEYISGDYTKAKENYDLVRSEFSNSVIAPLALERSNNIRTLLDLRNEIAKLEGRAVETDSTKAGGAAAEENVRDDGPIDLSMDGMWVNYSGRDRPPPISLTDLTETDLQRQALAKERVDESAATGDSTAAAPALTPAVVDSAALLKKQQEEELVKQRQLSGKYLALAEVLLFSFNKPDSAVKYYQFVVERNTDSTQTARALYSLAYLYNDILADSTLAQTVLGEIVELFPQTAHAEGARKKLGLPLVSDRVDSAMILFKRAENAVDVADNVDLAFALYDSIQSRYPNSPYAQKAAFAKAWHYEKTLFQLDEAVAVYETILKDFPNSPYVEKIKPKMTAVEQLRKVKEAKEKAVADSLARIQKAFADSVAADSLKQIEQKKAAEPPSTQTDEKVIEETENAPPVAESDKAAADTSAVVAAPTEGLNETPPVETAPVETALPDSSSSPPDSSAVKEPPVRPPNDKKLQE